LYHQGLNRLAPLSLLAFFSPSLSSGLTYGFMDNTHVDQLYNQNDILNPNEDLGGEGGREGEREGGREGGRGVCSYNKGSWRSLWGVS